MTQRETAIKLPPEFDYLTVTLITTLIFLLLLDVAVISHLPFFTAVITPLLETLATFLLLVAHFTVLSYTPVGLKVRNCLQIN